MSVDPGDNVPKHVCIIMDGNGRWAKKRLMPRSFGHRKGVESTRVAIKYCASAGVKFLTLFAFSSENWNRPHEEVESLMSLFIRALKDNTAELNDNGIRIRFIGDRNAFSPELQQQIGSTESLTAENSRMTVNVAANYGGRWDITQASRAVAQQVLDGTLSLDAVDEAYVSDLMALAGTPDPDLLIRTGGEKRISNFLLWQLAYTELYFCDQWWPDFSEQSMQEALDEYAIRQRRYGKTAEQDESADA